MIQVQKLTKKFGDIVAVDGASFEVRDGEVLGFLGPNGAGKTTTMRVITGFLAPTKGTIKVGDLDVREDSLEIRKKIGYLPEFVPLYNDMKVFEFLRFIAEVRGIGKSKIKQRISEMIEVCGLQKVIKQEIGELSKGYRQRVGLAQAMIHEPEILVLDEPTSGLDPNQIVEIRSLIKKIGEKKTVILSTHILSEVQATCSRVVIINEGKIVASGTVDELQKQAEGRAIIYVEVKGAGDEFETVAMTMFGVNKVNKVNNIVNNGTAWNIEIDPSAGLASSPQASSHSGLRASGPRTAGSPLRSEDLREQLFDLAVENGWKLLEMRREQMSLEDVFRKLTT